VFAAFKAMASDGDYDTEKFLLNNLSNATSNNGYMSGGDVT